MRDDQHGCPLLRRTDESSQRHLAREVERQRDLLAGQPLELLSTGLYSTRIQAGVDLMSFRPLQGLLVDRSQRTMTTEAESQSSPQLFGVGARKDDGAADVQCVRLAV